MSDHQPSNEPREAVTWRFIGRIVLKAAGLFVLLNLLFAAFLPLKPLGRLTLYNWLLPGRQRLPYGENPADSYNLSLDNIPAMLASHVVSQDKAGDEFRVLVIGDSGTWGWLLENDQTLAGQINAARAHTADGRRIVAYNLGYPIMALTKDLLLLDAARDTQPDLILWPVTLQSFPRDKQLVPPIVHNNPDPVRRLIAAYDLDLDLADPAFVEPNFLERTIAGQRRPLVDLLRLQLLGFSWAATGIDQAIPAEYDLRASDFEEDLAWLEYEEPLPLDKRVLAMEILDAAATMEGDVPVLVVNEPIYISDGRNSDLRYNAWYPRWAYDDYRERLAAAADGAEWGYLDLWDAIPPAEFTDSPVHLTPAGTARLAELLLPYLANP
jgi:hypothetical protein